MSIPSGIAKLRKKRKYHHMQETRKQHLQMIMSWDACKKDKPDRKQILRQIMIVIGCTKTTAEEYLNVVLGEEE